MALFVAVPGTEAKQCMITGNDREIWGNEKAFNNAFERLREEYLLLCKQYSRKRGGEVNFHVTLTFEE